MIFVTGDTHRQIDYFKLNYFARKNKHLTKKDFVIVAGDFGAIWDKKTLEQDLNKYSKLPWTTLFVDGNHENFDIINSYPVEIWNGGKVHKIRKDIIHLMRGQVFEIEGKKIFTFGGARSHDISAGILELDDPDFEKKRKKLDSGFEPYRVNHLSWWEKEMPTNEEMEEGRANLEKVNYEVDYVITHCCSSSAQCMLEKEFDCMFETDVLTRYFQILEKKLSYKHWYFGHYHANQEVDEKHTLLYQAMMLIDGEANLDKVSVPGRPRYMRTDVVKFWWKDTEKIGQIYSVDAYGTFEQREEPSYDIFVEEDNCIYKHIIESEILEKGDM